MSQQELQRVEVIALRRSGQEIGLAHLAAQGEFFPRRARMALMSAAPLGHRREHTAAMGLPKRDLELHTYADYTSWPDDTRYELIDGIAYAKSPAPTRRHQEITGEVFRQIADALEGSPCRAYIAPFDVRLPTADEADDAVANVVQPDISVICEKSKLDEWGCRGAPDWIIEVLSPGTAGHDQIVKRALYERVGVREFWLIHPADKLVTIYLLANGGYGKPVVQELAGTTAASILPGAKIDWDRVLRG